MIRDICAFLVTSLFIASMMAALPVFVAVFHDQQSAIAAAERN